MNRTNIKLIPSEATREKIAALLKKFQIPHDDFCADPHCTILYSHDVVDVKILKLPPLSLPIVGKNAKFELFDTRYDGVVLVIEFECQSAKECFRYLKQKYNFSTRYDEYRAHITMQKNLEGKNLQLPEIDFDPMFDKIEMDNG